jgi:hypothetical protein
VEDTSLKMSITTRGFTKDEEQQAEEDSTKSYRVKYLLTKRSLSEAAWLL